MNFRQYLETIEKPSGYFNSLKANFGIPTSQFTSMPQLGAFVKLRGNTSSGVYKIIDFGEDDDGNVTTARIQLMRNINSPANYRKIDGQQVEMPHTKNDEEPGEILTVSLNKLDQLGQQPFAALVAQSGAGGGMPMAPGI